MDRSDPEVAQHAASVDLVTSTNGGSPSRVPRAEQLLTPGEVAQMFGVDPKTVSRWADAGKLDAMRTLGGHRRYRVGEVEALLGDTDAN